MRSPSRASSILALVMYWLVRPWMMLVARPRFVVGLRGVIERTSARPASGTVVVDGPGGEWVRGPGVPEGRRSAILYLHGSGYVVCSPRTHRELVARPSRAAGVPAYSVDYRLAPEHPFPAAARALLPPRRPDLRHRGRREPRGPRPDVHRCGGPPHALALHSGRGPGGRAPAVAEAGAFVRARPAAETATA